MRGFLSDIRIVSEARRPKFRTGGHTGFWKTSRKLIGQNLIAQSLHLQNSATISKARQLYTLPDAQEIDVCNETNVDPVCLVAAEGPVSIIALARSIRVKFRPALELALVTSADNLVFFQRN